MAAPNYNYELMSNVHHVLYNRLPSSDELQFLLHLGVAEVDSPSSVARRMIVMRERQAYPTAFSIRFDEKDLIYYNIHGFEIALDKADQAVSLPIRRDNEFEADLTNCLRRNLKEGMNVLDIGANIGFFSMLCAGLVGPRGSVTSFEPNSENCRLLLLSIIRNGCENITLIPVALGAGNGSLFFSTAVGSNGGILNNQDPNTQLLSETCTIVPVIKLDNIIKSPVHLIKMDVEGAEALVVSGARETIQKNKPVICTEFCPIMLGGVSKINAVEFIEMIKSFGYKPFRLAREISNDAEVSIDNPAEFVAACAPDHLSELVFYPTDKS